MLKRQLLLLAVLGLLVGSGIATILPAGVSTLPTTARSFSTENVEMAPMATPPDPLWRVWLDNPHYLEVPNAIWVDVIIENRGEVGGYVNWTLWVNTTQRANDTLWVGAWSEGIDTYELTANGTFAWDKGPGYYELLLEVEYYGKFFEAWSWFVVREKDLQVWLNQDYYIEEGETMGMEVYINNSANMPKDVNWSLWVNNSKRIEYTNYHVAANSENITTVYLTADLIYPWYTGPGYYDVYLNVSYYGELYEAWCWFIVREKRLDLELWIEQAYYFDQYDWITLELHMNNSGPGVFVNTTLETEYFTPYHTNVNWSRTSYWLAGYTENVTNVYLYAASAPTTWFNGFGYYYVELNVTYYGQLYQAWCWFNVGSNHELYVSINQAYYYDVGESVQFEMNITNMTPSSDWINATLTVWNALTGYFTIYQNTQYWLSGYEKYYDFRSWTFDAPGYYEIYLDVYNESSGWWYEAECWVVIRDPGHEVWIDQPYYAELHEEAYFNLWFNYSSVPAAVDMDQLNVTLWANDTMIDYQANVDLSGTGFWSIPLQHSFVTAGYYDIWLRIYDTSGLLWYEAWCYIWIAELEVNLWIEQEYYFDLATPAWFDLHVVMPYNDFFYDNLNVTLLANGSKVFSGLYLFDGDQDAFMIGAIWESYIHKDRIFLGPPGYYDIELLVMYQGQAWSAWCYVWIEGEEGFELWIDQDTWARVGEEKWMTFNIENHFSHDMFAVEVKITMEGPSASASEILYHQTDIPMPAGSFWSHALSYVFPTSGIYYVRLVLWDDIGTEWSADCQWEVSDGSTDAFLDINAPEMVQVDEPFEVDAKIFAGVHGDLYVDNITLTYDDGILIAFEPVHETIPAETSRQFSFTATLEDIGEHTVRVTAETSKGMLENKIPIRVVEELPEDSRSSEPTAISPGFEFLPLALAGVVLLGLRRRR